MSEQEKKFGDRLRTVNSGQLIASAPAIAGAIDVDQEEQCARLVQRRVREIADLRAKIEAAVERMAFEVWCTPPGMDDEGEGDHEVLLRSGLTTALAGIFGPHPGFWPPSVPGVPSPTPQVIAALRAQIEGAVEFHCDALLKPGQLSPRNRIFQSLTEIFGPPKLEIGYMPVCESAPIQERPQRDLMAPDEPVTVCTCGGWESGKPHAADCCSASVAGKITGLRKAWDLAPFSLAQLRERLQAAQTACRDEEAREIATELRNRLAMKDAVRAALRRVTGPNQDLKKGEAFRMRTFGQQLGPLPTVAYSGDRRTKATGILNPDADQVTATVWEISGITREVLPDLQPGIGHTERADTLATVIGFALAAGFFDAYGVDRNTPIDSRTVLEVSLCFGEAGLLSPIWRTFAPQLGPDGPVDPKAKRVNPSGIAKAKHLNRHVVEAFDAEDRKAHGYDGEAGRRRYYSDVIAALRLDIAEGRVDPENTLINSPGYESVVLSLPIALEWEALARAPKATAEEVPVVPVATKETSPEGDERIDEAIRKASTAAMLHGEEDLCAALGALRKLWAIGGAKVALKKLSAVLEPLQKLEEGQAEGVAGE